MIRELSRESAVIPQCPGWSRAWCCRSGPRRRSSCHHWRQSAGRPWWWAYPAWCLLWSLPPLTHCSTSDPFLWSYNPAPKVNQPIEAKIWIAYEIPPGPRHSLWDCEDSLAWDIPDWEVRDPCPAPWPPAGISPAPDWGRGHHQRELQGSLPGVAQLCSAPPVSLSTHPDWPSSEAPDQVRPVT